MGQNELIAFVSENWLNIFSAISCIIGGSIALLQWQKSNSYKRAELVSTMVEKMRSDSDIAILLDIIDWDKGLLYDGEFLLDEGCPIIDAAAWEKDKLFHIIDRTLSFFSFYCYLRQSHSIKKADMVLVEYNLRRLADNPSIANYLFSIHHWSAYLGVTCSHKPLIDYCIKKNYLNKNFKSPDCKEYMLCLDIPRKWRHNGTVPIGDTEMSYVSFGSGKKVLILLPGLSDGLTTVEGKALLLAAPYRMFFKDFTVFMFSRKKNLPEGYSIREMADDQAEAMRKLGIKKASVLGVSEGGMIAQYLAIDYADLIEKLVIAVSAPKVNATLHSAVQVWIRLAKQKNHKQLMIDTAEKSYSEAYLKKYRKLYPVIGWVGKPKDYRRFLVNANAILHFDCFDELRKITCPTLIIGGRKDRIVGPVGSDEMHAQIKGSKLYMYEEYGHAAYEEDADFNQRVFDFLVG